MIRLVKVAGESMAPTYRPTDLLVTRRPGRAGLRRGDVAVFRHDGRRVIKRVVGVPGDLVELEAGRLFVNGESTRGHRRVPGAHTRTWRVPVAHSFMAGDNTAGSDDSRVWDEPFVPAARVEALVARRLGVPRRGARRPVVPPGPGLRAPRPAAAADRAG